jgi:MerR family transcriptional regulator, light-induced transcriptional regulator
MQASFNPVSSEQPRYRSGAVARMVRIPVATLRIWERRYQVVGPALTPSGHRLYSGADVERLLLIKQLVDQGHAIGSLARLTAASLLEITDARAMLSAPASTAAPVRARAALIGLGLPRRLGAIALQRVVVWADLAAADQAMAAQPPDGTPLRAELLVAELATLQPDSANRLLALMRRLGAEQAVVVYGFGPEVVAERLRRAGCSLHRAPMDDAALRTLVSTLCASTTGLLRVTASPDGTPTPLAGPANVPPRRFDDDTLVQLAAASGTMACECPRHVAELVMMLAHFETYSAECVNRGPDDAALHTHLHRVAGTARAMFEDALVRVAEAESLPVPLPMG